jgi:hypothetical protein
VLLHQAVHLVFPETPLPTVRSVAAVQHPTANPPPTFRCHRIHGRIHLDKWCTRSRNGTPSCNCVCCWSDLRPLTTNAWQLPFHMGGSLGCLTYHLQLASGLPCLRSDSFGHVGPCRLSTTCFLSTVYHPCRLSMTSFLSACVLRNLSGVWIGCSKHISSCLLAWSSTPPLVHARTYSPTHALGTHPITFALCHAPTHPPLTHSLAQSAT